MYSHTVIHSVVAAAQAWASSDISKAAIHCLWHMWVCGCTQLTHGLHVRSTSLPAHRLYTQESS